MPAKVYEDEVVMALYKEGLNDAEIARRLIVDTSTILRWRKKNNLPANTRRGGAKRPPQEPPKPKQTEGICNDKIANGCFYWDDHLKCCDYYLVHGIFHRRPCKAGKDCTARKVTRKKKGGS